MTRRIARGAGLAMLGTIANQACFLFAGIAIARYLGPEAFGVYSLAMSLSLAFVALSGGLPTVLVRGIARDEGKAGLYVGSTLLVMPVLMLVAFVLLSLAVALMELSPLQVQAVYMAALANLAFAYGRIVISAFRAFGRIAYEGALLLVQGLAFLVLVLYAVYMGANLVAIIGVLLASHVLMVVLGYRVILKRLTRSQFRIDLSLCDLLIREAAPIGITYFLLFAYERIGSVALEIFYGSAEVGLFSTAFNLTRHFSFIPLIIAGAVLPAFSRFVVSSPARLAAAYGGTLKLLVVFALPLAIGSAILARPIILLFYGAEFVDAGAALQVIAWALLFLFLSLGTKTILEAIGRQNWWTWALVVGVLVSLILNVILVPRMGLLGASLAMVLADAVILGVASYLLSRELSMPATIVKDILKCLVSGALMALVMVRFSHLDLVALIALGAVVYGLSLLVFRVFGHQEVVLIGDVIGLRKLADRLSRPGMG